MRDIAGKILANFGLTEVSSNGDGFLIFSLIGRGMQPSRESSPTALWGTLMVLKQWHPQLK